MENKLPHTEQKAEYQAIINTLFPDDVHGMIAVISDFSYDIHPEEQALVRDAIQKRINEFSAGRFCAHHALSGYALSEQPLLIGEHRQPLWPTGIVGSITHCRDLAGAVVTRMDNYLGIGFDIENIKKTKNDISKHVCTTGEKYWLQNQSYLPYETAVLLVFSIKESVYKCIYTASSQRLGFQECDIEVNPDTGIAFCHINTTRYNDINRTLLCRYIITERHIFSGLVCSLS